MQDRIYVGNGKERTVAGVPILKFTLSLDTLNDAFAEHGFTTDVGRTKIKVDIWPNKNGADQYGNTHSVQVDTFKPNTPPSRPGAGDAQFPQAQAPATTPPPFPSAPTAPAPAPQPELPKDGGFEDESVDDIPF